MRLHRMRRVNNLIDLFLFKYRWTYVCIVQVFYCHIDTVLLVCFFFVFFFAHYIFIVVLLVRPDHNDYFVTGRTGSGPVQVLFIICQAVREAKLSGQSRSLPQCTLSGGVVTQSDFSHCECSRRFFDNISKNIAAKRQNLRWSEEDILTFLDRYRILKPNGIGLHCQ